MKPIALQLYTLRTLEDSFSDILDKVKNAGYSGVELTGPSGMKATELKALLNDKGLKATSCHVNIAMLEHALDYVLPYHQELGNDTLIVPFLAEGERDWPRLAERLNAIYNNVKPHGFKLLYHNHDFEMVKVGDKTALDVVMENTNPEIGFELDAAWIHIGGQDVLDFLERYSGRVPKLHAKDARETREVEGGLADVGAGVLEWSNIIPAAKEAGVEWFVVEHDFPTDPIESITNSASFLNKHL